MLTRIIAPAVAVAFALTIAGCTTSPETEPAPAPASTAPAVPVAPAVPAAPVPAPSVDEDSTAGMSEAEDIDQIIEDIERQQDANMQQLREQARDMDMPVPPSTWPGDPGYDEQMQQYNAEIDQYMREYGNAYTIPENQR